YMLGGGADLDVAVEPGAGGLFGDRCASPGRTDTGDAVNGQHFTGADDDGVFLRPDFKDEAWFAVVSGFADGQAATLPNGESLGARVGADLLAFGVQGGTLGHIDLFFHPTASVAVGNEATVMLLGFLGNRQA